MQKYIHAAFLLLVILFPFQECQALIQPKGTAGNPFQKKKVAVVGGGGFLGAVTFGFLQRASSLYKTGIGGVRCIGATSDTAIQLNRILSRAFCLAFADESYIKLTDLENLSMIERNLQGYDAIFFGTELSLQLRPVSIMGSSGKGPNDKTWEAYLGERGGTPEGGPKEGILDNFLQASRQAGIKHMVVIDDGSSTNLIERLDSCGVPYTCIRVIGEMLSVQSYTYRLGVQGDLSISNVTPGSAFGRKEAISSSTISPIAYEDIAALAVQCLQSLDWTQSRCLQVSCNGPLNTGIIPGTKRPDQEWCVNSIVLEEWLHRL